MSYIKIYFLLLVVLLSSCNSKNFFNTSLKLDYLLVDGLVYSGENALPKKANVGLCGEIICYIGNEKPESNQQISAKNLVVTPGFIDPHTHTIEELYSKDKNNNLNYLTQGVTTVFNGNDGDGFPQIQQISKELMQNGIGTNLALLVGHGAIRTQVMGKEERAPTDEELNQMKALVNKAMQEGAFGFSSGLYYVPGIYSNTKEVIELAKVAAKYNGVYDTHLRDESTFNIGFLKAVEEAIEIAKQADIHLHIAHIKALGVDVWGQSLDAITMIENAQKKGISISADQYPWQASGTNLNSAIMPAWIRADSDEQFRQRLQNKSLLPRIKSEIKENIRRRGGGKALLITETTNPNWLGLNLAEIAKKMDKTEVDAAIEIALIETVRVASFNMSNEDIINFMQQDWVLSSSDGTNGHPRKYASFPRKYQEYVDNQKALSMSEFIHKSSGKTAVNFGIKKRGFIKQNYIADINVINLTNYKANADFSNWNKLSTGIQYQFINGKMTIKDGEYSGALAGKVLLRD